MLSYSLGADVRMRTVSQMLTKFDKFKQILVMEIMENSETDAKVYVNNLRMVMVNRHLDKVMGKTTSEDLLLPSSICIRYDQVTHPPKESDISTFLVDFEPLELKLGYRELDNFKGVNEVCLDLIAKLNPEIMDSENMNYETYEDKKRELEDMNEKEQRRALGESPKIKAFRERRVKELVLLNIQLQMKSFVILLLDDTKDIEHPIINFNIHDVKVKCSLESGQDSPAIYILKKMAIYQYPILKVEAELSLGADYFNHSNGAYEPLIEPWEVFATVKQKDIGSSQIINVKSTKMLNLNLTYGVAICLKNVLDALKQNSEDWVDEVQLEEIKRKATMKKNFSYSSSVRHTSMSGTEDAKVSFKIILGWIPDSSESRKAICLSRFLKETYF